MLPKIKEFRPEKLSQEQLMELFELDTQMVNIEQEDTIGRLVETSIDIIGKKGRGKTLTGVAIAYQLRERFNRPVICVGSKMGLNESFGPYQFMGEMDFRNEMERISLAADEEENAEQVAKMFDKYGISILYSTIVFDEAYKLFEARRSMDKMVQLTGYFMAQQRHYHVTTIFMSPDEKLIDKRIVQQVDWKGRCFHNKYNDMCRARFVQGLDVLTLDVDGMDDLLHPPYYYMYNSWALVGYRKASLNIKEG
jgi:hypothetical protein